MGGGLREKRRKITEVIYFGSVCDDTVALGDALYL